MYRQGLGDCFLVTFTNAAGEQYHMVVDCGVLPFSTGGDKRVDLIAQNILSETGNHLQTVIATHEHADHISGFKSAREYLGTDPAGKYPGEKPANPPKVDKVWLAWTEDLQDPQVKKILAKGNALSLSIAAAVMGLGKEKSKAVRDILLFNGAELEIEESPGMGADTTAKPKFKISKTMQEIMELLRGWGQVEYLEPGDVQKLTNFGVRVHILGPSRKMAMLGGNAPAYGEGDQGLKLTQASAFMAAAIKFAGMELDEKPEEGLSQADINALYKISLPFDPLQSLPLEVACQPYPLPERPTYPQKLQASYRDFYKEFYGINGESTDQAPEWRRIDTDWLQASESLALQQVSIINNTSLVMAIELTESGKVLLFAADAEEDNWNTWEAERGNLDQLLANTVVYKVGHHGSINATDQKMLMEKMTNKELVALIPVDVKRAEDNQWEFPAKVLYDLENPTEGLLYHQTGGRIILNCGEQCADCKPLYDENLPWPGKISSDTSADQLWVDYLLAF